MTTIIHGDNGIVFPDATTQGTALTTGAQNITGQKTFLSAPVFSSPPVSAATPAFGAYNGSSQSITQNVWTKLTLPTEEFDPTGAFNNTGVTVGSAPAYSFNPQVAGYYQFNLATGLIAPSGSTYITLSLYKNGASFKLWSNLVAIATANYYISGSALVYLNGSTDYVEMYINHNGAAAYNTPGGSNSTYASGFLVARSA